MELNFEQVNGAYVASVKVDSAYALHLERAGRCPLAVLQRHGEAGQYVPCPLPAVTGSLAPAVVDVALDHCVYPVEVKIVSGLEPHVSTLTPYAGGGGGGGIPDAPQDGVLYGRKDGTWSAVPDPSGDIADLQGRMDTAEGDIDALQQADAAQDGRLDALETSQGEQDGKIDALEAADTQLGERLAAAEGKITTAEGEIDALEARMDPIADKVEAMPAAYTLDSSLFHITDESTSEQIRDALEASGGFEAIVEALKRGDALYLHYSGEGWDGTYTESGINLVYGYVIEDDNGTTNLCLYFTRKNNIDVYDIYHDPDDDTYSARNLDYDLSVLDSDEYPLSTLGQKYQQLEASQAQQDEKITALETAQTEQGQRLTAAEGDIAALEGRMDTAEGEIDALQQADTQQDGRLDALETADTEQDEKITALETADTAQDEKIAALETADTQLGERLTAAEGEIDALQQADAGQDEKITALEAADAAHDEAIGSLETKVEGLEAGGGFPEAPQDGTLYGRKDAAWAPVPDPSGEITALEGRMDTAEGEIDALQQADTAQDGRLDALEASQTSQDGKITALEAADAALGERLDTAEGKITTAEGEIDALQQADTAQDGRLDALETSQTAQDEKITALETADTELGERLTAAEGKITAAEGDIDDLSGRVETLEEQGGGGGGAQCITLLPFDEYVLNEFGSEVTAVDLFSLKNDLTTENLVGLRLIYAIPGHENGNVIVQDGRARFFVTLPSSGNSISGYLNWGQITKVDGDVIPPSSYYNQGTSAEDTGRTDKIFICGVNLYTVNEEDAAGGTNYVNLDKML